MTIFGLADFSSRTSFPGAKLVTFPLSFFDLLGISTSASGLGSGLFLAKKPSRTFS